MVREESNLVALYPFSPFIIIYSLFLSVYFQ